MPFLVALAFDWTINLGQVIQIVVVLSGVIWTLIKFFYTIDKRMVGLATDFQKQLAQLAANLDKRMSMFEGDVVSHTKAIADHASRMERWESTLFKVVGDLQRVIGRMEVGAGWDGRDRRHHDKRDGS